MRSKPIEIIVGLFMIAGLLALFVLAVEISGLGKISYHSNYILTADFDNIGSLKVRAPVRVSGITVGRISAITLDPKTFRATVTMEIDNAMKEIPVDTSASIFTEGLLGSNYINLSPGLDKEILKTGESIQTTHSALILENLIGQFLFSMKKG